MITEPQLSTRQIVSHNPATGEVLATFPCATAEDVASAAHRARTAPPTWAALSVRRRTAVLRQFQRLLVEQKETLARQITRECGKPYVEALLSEVLVALDAARFCAEHAYSALQPQPIPHGSLPLKAKSGHLLREPYGVVGIVSPWNYPFSTPASEVLPALVTGNAVLLKPSELTTLAGRALVRLLHEAGVPEDVVQLLPGDGETGAALVAADIDKLIFTGSVATGKRVAGAGAARLLPVVLELGGKDPMVVLDDAGVNVASSAAVWGAFVNAGQACLSVERCYVHRSIFEPFVAACVEKTRKLRVGNGLDPDIDMGPLINQRQLRVIESQVEDARAHGARVLTGGERLPELGPNFYAPSVIIDVNHSMRLMREETFGPVLPIMPFDTDDQAVALANDSEYGLAASIWTRNRRRGEALARRLEAGTVMVNDVVSCFAISEAPHGGVKASGVGHTHGRIGLEEVTRLKYIDSDLLPRMRKGWWYGYSSRLASQMEALVDFLFSPRLPRRLTAGMRALPALLRKQL